MHFWFGGVDFWRARSWNLASSTGISAVIVNRRGERKEGDGGEGGGGDDEGDEV
jgi:hypothetical protein